MITRREFFRKFRTATVGGAAAIGIAALGLPVLSALPKPKPWKTYTRYKGGFIHGLPTLTWRKIYGGTDWAKRNDALIRIMEETNEILDDMEQIEGPGVGK
tara:strand:+ start:142 stop:444 length:303 start_codon:yes stop_codon:yes gene_type:complete